ncbi:MAG: type VI secretion system ATPase TssH, partial [Candidatus Rokubacteria bacterium]|nr:type VI secretion system ATPase TssH [Candidatus Rokubacteria bacterium]
MKFDFKTLIGKLNSVSRTILQNSIVLCQTQTNYNVELEHVLLKMLEGADNDYLRLLRYYEVDREQLTRELTQSMEKLPRGNTRSPAMSQHVVDLLQEAWVRSSLILNAPTIRTGSMLLALVDTDGLRGLLIEQVPSLAKIPREAIRKDMREIIRESIEEPGTPASAAAPAEAATPTASGAPVAPNSQSPALDQYTIDLTARAR